jgi:hypothetical protein
MTQVDPVFSTRMRELRENANSLYRSLQGTVQRQWNIPVAATQPLQDVASLHVGVFDRSRMNADYNQLIKGASPASSNSNGEAIGIRMQIAAVAVEERAYRHRHMSLARAICTAHGRCYGQGAGELFSPTGIEGDVAALIRAGSRATV